MSSSGVDRSEALAQSVSATGEALIVELADARTITVPLAWFPLPDPDEDISVESLLAGRRSGETRDSLRRWRQSRKTG